MWIVQKFPQESDQFSTSRISTLRVSPLARAFADRQGGSAPIETCPPVTYNIRTYLQSPLNLKRDAARAGRWQLPIHT